MRLGYLALLLAIFLNNGCNNIQQAKGAEPTMPLPGYAGIKFAQNFSEVETLVSTDLFNPVGYFKCLQSIAVRGCLLSPKDSLARFKEVDGIPYGLSLAFNSHGQLTDIGLEFSRSTTDESLDGMTSTDCRVIHARTLDWLIKEFGLPNGKRQLRGDSPSFPATTPAGANYFYRKWKPEGFISESRWARDNRRSIFLLSHFLNFGTGKSCDVRILFSDDDKIERWRLSPEDKKGT